MFLSYFCLFVCLLRFLGSAFTHPIRGRVSLSWMTSFRKARFDMFIHSVLPGKTNKTYEVGGERMEYLDLMEEACGKAERNTKKFISEEETPDTSSHTGFISARVTLRGCRRMCTGPPQLWGLDCEQTSPPAPAEVFLHPMPPLLTHVT